MLDDKIFLHFGAIELNGIFEEVLSAREVHIIDAKLDDGLPGSGRIVDMWTWDPVCRGSGGDYDQYDVQNPDAVCVIGFEINFDPL